uniref:DNA/RNA non-specific endonuclease/pyrophosphatase/phosphodiesterase domain-containing protein n=1 Tax=Paramormyrops kingsleyae TaxID=1676925 RepID=A0A3B3Q6E1_9TELE
ILQDAVYLLFFCVHSKDLLFMETPPHSFPNARFKICQRLVDMPRNATQYDPKNRISIYSAYTFKKTEENWKVDYPWMYEPQLTLSLSLSLSPLNMQPFPQCHLHMKFEDSQAVLEHYANTVLYERGHLNPDQHQSDPHKQVATYTLTNVKPWHDHMTQCHNQKCLAYCRTGFDRDLIFKEGNIVPELSAQDPETYLTNTINVPVYMQIFYKTCITPSLLSMDLEFPPVSLIRFYCVLTFCFAQCTTARKILTSKRTCEATTAERRGN